MDVGPVWAQINKQNLGAPKHKQTNLGAPKNKQTNLGVHKQNLGVKRPKPISSTAATSSHAAASSPADASSPAETTPPISILRQRQQVRAKTGVLTA